MKRLLTTMRCDLRLQSRNGFYWAVAFLLAAWAVVITQLPEFDWGPFLPPLLLGNLVMATFFFMGGLVLLEKGEGTLEAQIVTPLTSGEYLTSKVVTLTALSIAESVTIVMLAYGTALRWVPLIVGIALASALYCLFGFVVVARYDSINEYLFPSMIYTTLFYLPILDYAGIWRSSLVYLHPFQAPLTVLEGTFFPIATWKWVYGVLYSALWIGLVFVWSRRVFRQFVVARAGAR
jgi:fluoroquinolone transport system permease protein